MEIKPLEYNVVIRPDEVEEKTKGGLYIPENTRDREGAAAFTGTLLSYSDGAFQYEAGGNWLDHAPAIGARVLYVRYAGVWWEEKGVRVMKDKDVVAVIE